MVCTTHTQCPWWRMLYKRSMWNRIAKTIGIFRLLLTVYIHTETHFAWLSQQGLNNKHIRKTTSVSFKLILLKIYSENSLKQSMSHDLNRRLTLKMQGQVPRVRRNTLSHCYFLVIQTASMLTLGIGAILSFFFFDRYEAIQCNSTECNFPICVSTCMQIHI